MSTQFLGTKSFHPKSKANQKAVWVAQQRAKDHERREREAAAELVKARDSREVKQLVSGRAAVEGSSSVSFLYAAPPGLKQALEKEKEREKQQQRKQGAAGGSGSGGGDGGGGGGSGPAEEDEAVKAFNRRLERTKLEAAAGTRARLAEPTLAEQVERFPWLKNAPVEGSYSENIEVRFNPLGKQIRNVRCMRCNEWGHRSGDRECPLAGVQHPNDAHRKKHEDPMAALSAPPGQLQSRIAYMNHDGPAMKLQAAATAAAAAAGGGPGGPGGAGSASASSVGGHGGIGDRIELSAEQRLLEGMSQEEKRALLRQLEDEGLDGREKDRRRAKKDKKEKREKRKRSRHRRDSDSDESSSGSDYEGDGTNGDDGDAARKKRARKSKKKERNKTSKSKKKSSKKKKKKRKKEKREERHGEDGPHDATDNDDGGHTGGSSCSSTD